MTSSTILLIQFRKSQLWFFNKKTCKLELPPILNNRELTSNYGGTTLYPHRSSTVSEKLSTTKSTFLPPTQSKIAPFLLNSKATGYLKNPLTNDLRTFNYQITDKPAERFISEYDVCYNKRVLKHVQL